MKSYGVEDYSTKQDPLNTTYASMLAVAVVTVVVELISSRSFYLCGIEY